MCSRGCNCEVQAEVQAERCRKKEFLFACTAHPEGRKLDKCFGNKRNVKLCKVLSSQGK